MSSLPQDLFRYWRGSLLDGAHSRKASDYVLHEISFDCLAEPNVQPEAIFRIKEDIPRQERRAFEDGKRKLPVVIAPIVLGPRHEHGSPLETSNEIVVPLWIEGELDKDGMLTPSGAFVDRSVISPLGDENDSHPVFVSLNALDKEEAMNATKDETWIDFFVELRAWFERLFGAPLEEWQPEGMSRKSMIGYSSDTSNSAASIRMLYERLEKEPKVPALIGSLCSGRRNPPREDVPRPEKSAQMGAIHPLNPGQRKALAATLALGPGELLAVNGPPGTGKTTLLQSVIASLWVASAAEGDRPPVILASSTNNQAITNILDSLAGVSIPENHPLIKDGLGERWIPGLKQYGLYLPSQTLAEKIENKIRQQDGEMVDPKDVIACPVKGNLPWNGLPRVVENESYVGKANDYYRIRSARWFGEELDVARIVDGLRHRLLERLEQINLADELRRRLLEADPSVKTASSSQAHRQSIRLQLEENQMRLEDLKQAGHDAISEYHGIVGVLFGWFAPVRRASWNRAQQHLTGKNLADVSWNWKTVLDEKNLREWLFQKEETLKQQIRKIEELLDLWSRWGELTDALLPGLLEKQLLEALSEESCFQNLLDTLPRAELFHLAGRYWEGRWLLLMEELLGKAKEDSNVLNGRSRIFCESRWHRYAMLTPCLVATAHTAPKLFDYYRGKNLPLLEFIDLLIVDEAGQVSPAVGSALFGLARRALVVGDVLQLEPVWEVNDLIDRGNLRHHELVSCEVDLERFEGRGIRSSSGSIMKMAREATAFSETSGSNGFLLREHWRCHPDVISFCNTLAYQGELIPKRSRNDSFPLPRLGYAHVQGECRRRGTSPRNPDEARVIAAWLTRHREEFLSRYSSKGGKKPKLGDIVGIITPFKAQAIEIKKALRASGLSHEDADSISAGTVHTLQGAERPIILFSSVYDSQSRPPTLFFDRGINMLNVAVSRAKESFLVFGDMALFQNNGSDRPSSILAAFLFADPANEITDIDPVLPVQTKPEEIQRIDSLEGHRQLLRQAILTARHRLLIVSPYLAYDAMVKDELIALFAQSLSTKGMVITIAYDRKLNQLPSGEDKPGVQQVLAALKAIPGLDIRSREDIHNKTLVVDDEWIVEGSFNWLSAVRDPNRSFARHEVSLVYAGSQVSDFSAKAWKQIGGMNDEGRVRPTRKP